MPGENPWRRASEITHTNTRRFKLQARLEPAQQHRKADMLTVTPHVPHTLHVAGTLINQQPTTTDATGGGSAAGHLQASELLLRARGQDGSTQIHPGDGGGVTVLAQRVLSVTVH